MSYGGGRTVERAETPVALDDMSTTSRAGCWLVCWRNLRRLRCLLRCMILFSKYDSGDELKEKSGLSGLLEEHD